MTRRIMYSFFAVAIIAGMAYQSAFRATEMRSFSDVKNAFAILVSGETQSGRSLKGELAGGINGTVAWVVTNYGKSVPYAYFYSIYAMVVNPFPRLYWPEKPVGWGRRVAWEILGQPPGSRGTSMAAGIAGEAYANGGIPAIILFSLAFGVFFGWMNFRLFNPKSIVSAGFWLSALTWTLGLWRGDWLSNVNRLFYCILGAWLIYQSLKWVFGKGAMYILVEDKKGSFKALKENQKIHPHFRNDGKLQSISL
jgi:hypothetical protein